jgi:predicted transcriptional regulator
LRDQIKRHMEVQMNKHLDANQRQFGPQQYKSFEGALFAFFEKECPQLGGERTRRVLVQTVAEMVRSFYPQTSHLQPGQTTWVAVHKDAGPAYGKSIADTKLTPVVLDLLLADEAARRAKGEKLRDLKRDAAARLFNQAYQQDGVLTNTEVALLLKLSPSTVGKYVAQWETERNQVLPRRGTIHDMGPSLTHKRIIIHKLFIEQHTVERVARDTNHSFDAIQNYIGTFRQVLLCRKKQMTTGETAFAIKRTPRLVQEYETIIEHYGTQSEVLNRLLEFNPKVK